MTELAQGPVAEYADRLARPRAVGGTDMAQVVIGQRALILRVPAVSIVNSHPIF